VRPEPERAFVLERVDGNALAKARFDLRVDGRDPLPGPARGHPPVREDRVAELNDGRARAQPLAEGRAGSEGGGACRWVAAVLHGEGGDVAELPEMVRLLV
ncbi:MAG: hypothetical protein ACK56I_07600, partial [bacterium]